MGLKLASTLATTFLFAMVYALVFIVGIWFLPSDLFGLLLMIGFTILIVLFQYGISPLMIRWIYRIDWIPYEEYALMYPHLGNAIDKVVEVQGIKTPRVGIIHDQNPSAFTFGYTKNSARLVITDGILHYLNEREQTAVVAHELGHIVHNDFVLMTVVFAIPLIFLTVARWSYYAARFSGGRKSSSDDSGGYIYLALFAISLISYIMYYIGFLVSLVVSRIREYYADQHAAELTEDPNTLSTALVKIAYGLLIATKDVDIKERNKSKVRALRGLGIFDPKKAKQIAIQGMDGSGKYSKDVIQAAAGWDLFNPWAKYFQIFSTHPLPAKRIQRLNSQCATYDVPVEIDFSNARKIKEEQVGKSMVGEFTTDILIKKMPSLFFWIAIGFSIVWLVGYLGIWSLGAFWSLQNLCLLWTAAFFIMGFAVIGRTKFMYRKGSDPKTVVDLVTQINVSPVRPIPAVIEGVIVGKGVPGYYFSEDLMFQDNTGLMYIDYRFGLRIVDFFWAITKVKHLIGQTVRIRGWYRRGPSPYFQIDRLETREGRTFRNYSKHATYILAVVFFLLGVLLSYLYFTAFV
ncbi:MAG: M48 family metalloprotease [Candidatus Lokiarchaeota archaeon]|nr:M48 family metalloprotease [Candidatus Lokiarchaeota archaeon]